MLKQKVILTIISVLLVLTMVGCFSNDNGSSENASTISGENLADNNNENNNGSTQEGDVDKQKSIIEEFNSLLEGDVAIVDIVDYMDKNISKLSIEDATKFVTGFEQSQEKYLPTLEENINNNKAVIDNIEMEHGEGLDINKIDSTKDEDLKKLLIEIRDSGYKIEMTEGYFFPVINYEFYKKYSQYVSEDIKDYINLMATESNKFAAKDAGIIISWEEVLERAQNQEKFIKKYENSTKINVVKKLYRNYTYLALYGADNTPLFSFDKKVMPSNIKDVYLEATKNVGESEFLKIISDYMEILKKNNYKLTDEIENFRKNIINIEDI